MKIAYITDEYPPILIGGAGKVAERITERLAKLGHKVYVFTPEEKHVSRILKKNIEIIPIKINKSLPYNSIQFWLKLPRFIKKYNKKIAFDVIHFNGLSYGFFKKKIINIPHIVTIHHLVKDTKKSVHIKFIKRIKNFGDENSFIMQIIEKRCLNYCDKIIAVSNFTKNSIIEEYGISSDKIISIHNGVDMNEYINSKNKSKKSLAIDNKQKSKILFVGRIDDPRKGLDILLKAISIVIKKSDIELFIVGKGDKKVYCDQASDLDILKNIKFLGFVDEQDLKKLFIECDIYVSSSRLEGFGLTIVEAMAAGKPIIATKAGAVPELINNNENGFLVNVDDSDEMAKSILKLLKNKKLAEKIGENNFKNVNENFSWIKNVMELEQVYENMTGG